jgi:hypothetical protein
MARAAKSAAVAANPKAGTAVTNWDEQLAAEAQVAAAAEANAGGATFFSVQGGVLSFNDSPIPGNAIAVVIVDTMFENIFYEGKYDPSNPSPPTCFAFAKEEDELAPHKSVVELEQAQNDVCAGCPMNAWGTADQGRGKACRNVRRLALLPAGQLDNGKFTLYDEEEHFSKAAMGVLKLPVTSVKGYAAFVKQIAGALKRPPFGIITKISVTPDPKTQLKVVFEAISKVPDHLMASIVKRRGEAPLLLDQPYNLEVDEAPKSNRPAARGRAAASPVSARPAAKKAKTKF